MFLEVSGNPPRYPQATNHLCVNQQIRNSCHVFLRGNQGATSDEKRNFLHHVDMDQMWQDIFIDNIMQIFIGVQMTNATGGVAYLSTFNYGEASRRRKMIQEKLLDEILSFLLLQGYIITLSDLSLDDEGYNIRIMFKRSS